MGCDPAQSQSGGRFYIRLYIQLLTYWYFHPYSLYLLRCVGLPGANPPAIARVPGIYTFALFGLRVSCRIAVGGRNCSPTHELFSALLESIAVCHDLVQF